MPNQKNKEQHFFDCPFSYLPWVDSKAGEEEMVEIVRRILVWDKVPYVCFVAASPAGDSQEEVISNAVLKYAIYFLQYLGRLKIQYSN